MSLLSRTFLLLTDQTETREKISAAINPIAKNLIHASTDNEAILKAKNQDFDAIILRMSQARLEEPNSAFHWCKSDKKCSKIPWVILGTDIESQDQVVKYSNLKFLPEPLDGAALIKLLEALLYDSNSNKVTLDVNFINPVVAATLHTLESMAQIKLVRGTPKLRKSGEPVEARGDISGVIAMNSDRFLGSTAICFEEKLILKVFSNMMGTETNEISDDVKDAVAEITNIIFGNAKRDLNAVGHTIAAAIPSVVSGKGHEIRHSTNGVCIVIPFESDFGRLLIECMIRPID